MNEVDLILGETLFKIHIVDARHKLMCFVVCYGKKVSLKSTKNPIIRGNILNFGLNGPMKNEQIVVVLQLKQLQGTRENARLDGPHPKHICEVLARFKDVFINDLSQKFPPRRK